MTARRVHSASQKICSVLLTKEVQPRSDTSSILDSDNKNNKIKTDGELENTSCIMKTDKLIVEEEAQPADEEDNMERGGESVNTPCRMRTEELVVQEAQPDEKKREFGMR